MLVLHIPTSQLVVMPQGLALAAQQLASATGALDSIDTDVPGTEAVSYDALDEVPELAGPLVDVRAENRRPPVKIEELNDPSFYEGLEGSDFETQRAFVQGLLGRRLPHADALHEFYLLCDASEGALPDIAVLAGHMKGEDAASESLKFGALSYLTNLDLGYLKVQSAVAQFLRGLAYSSSKEADPEVGYHLLTLAARTLSRANFDGVAAISHRLGMLAAPGYINTILDNRYVINYLFSSMMSGRNAAPLGKGYLYALHYSKMAGDFDRMQGLLLYSGKVRESQGLTEAAVRAYVASLWVFFNNEPVTVEMREGAIAALRMVGMLRPQHESQVGELIEQLEGAKVVSDPHHYVDTAMYYEHAGRVVADGKPDLAALFNMSAHAHEGHDGEGDESN